MPKLKGMRFATAAIERCKRRETSVEEAIIEMYLADVSTRRIEDVGEIPWGAGVSAGTVSQAEVDPFVEGDGVTVAAGLPVAGQAGLHQQALALVTVVGGNLGGKQRARAHRGHPFCQDEKTLKVPIGWTIGLNCRFSVLPMALRAACCTSESRLPLCA